MPGTNTAEKRQSARTAPIIACRDASLTAGENGELPRRLKLLQWGVNETRKGRFLVNDETVRLLSAMQAAQKRPRVAVDFEHNTVERRDAAGNLIKPAEPQALAAWGTPVVIPDQGLFLDDVDWLTAGKKHVPADYPDLSAAPVRNDRDEVVFLHSAGVCRHGEVDGITVLPQTLSAALAAASHPPKSNMADNQNPLRAALAALLTALGGDPVSDTATDEDLAAAALAAAEKAKPDEKPADAVESLSARIDNMEKRAILTNAAREGKVIPLSDADALKLPVDTLSAMVSRLPAGEAPVNGAPPASRSPGGVSQQPATLSATDADVAARLGISAETFLKHNPDDGDRKLPR